MTVRGPAPGNCWGCTHRTLRRRGQTTTAWCVRHYGLAGQRCTDYLHERRAHVAALRFYAAASGK